MKKKIKIIFDYRNNRPNFCTLVTAVDVVVVVIAVIEKIAAMKSIILNLNYKLLLGNRLFVFHMFSAISLNCHFRENVYLILLIRSFRYPLRFFLIHAFEF